MSSDKKQKKFDVSDGYVGKNILLEADDDKFMIQGNMTDYRVLGETPDDHKIVPLISIFRHMFKDFSPEDDINVEDCHFYMEIDKECFKQKYRDVVEGEGVPVILQFSGEDVEDESPAKFGADVRFGDEKLKEELEAEKFIRAEGGSEDE